MAIFRKSRNARQESLSTDVEAYYSDAYSQIASSGAFGVMSKLQHRQMEKSTLLAGASGQRVLEVGAGSGQHISFVDSGSWSEYIQTDLRPPGLTVGALGTWVDACVNADNLPFEDQSFDRLISTCVLVHTSDPALTLKEWRRVVRPGGVITVYLPCESSLLLNLARLLGPRQARIKAGFDPRIIYLDHRYTYKYLKTLVELEFPQSQIHTKRFPRLLPWWLSWWEIVQIKV